MALEVLRFSSYYSPSKSFYGLVLAAIKACFAELKASGLNSLIWKGKLSTRVKERNCNELAIHYVKSYLHMIVKLLLNAQIHSVHRRCILNCNGDNSKSSSKSPPKGSVTYRFFPREMSWRRFLSDPLLSPSPHQSPLETSRTFIDFNLKNHCRLHMLFILLIFMK